jgi:hypothetical protein
LVGGEGEVVLWWFSGERVEKRTKNPTGGEVGGMVEGREQRIFSLEEA